MRRHRNRAAVRKIDRRGVIANAHALAEASLNSVPEILIPSLHQKANVLRNHLLDLPDLRAAKAAVPFKTNRIKPELRLQLLALFVDMRRLYSIL